MLTDDILNRAKTGNMLRAEPPFSGTNTPAYIPSYIFINIYHILPFLSILM